jgi:hypothetical protein
MLHEAFGEHSLSQRFLNGIHISRPVECQLMMNVQGNQLPAKQQKMLTKFENSSTKTIAKESMSSQTLLGSVMEFARDLNRKFEHLLHCPFIIHDHVPAHMSLKTTEFVTNNNMVITPHPPYSPDLAPCDFALFPKLKMKLKG